MIFDPSVKNPFQRPIGWISGDKIDIDTSKYLHVDYGVQLTSIINKVGDNSCDNYPSQDHYSYEVCVRAELAGKVKPVFGCMIPWMSNKDACDKPVPITPSRTKLNADHAGLSPPLALLRVLISSRLVSSFPFLSKSLFHAP